MANAVITVAAATTAIRIGSSLNHRHSMNASRTPSPEVISHLIEYTAAKNPVVCDAAPQFAKTRMPTSTAKKAAVCDRGRPASGSGNAAAAATFCCSSWRKISAISKPMITLNVTAPTARAIPSCAPRTLAVITIASTLMAGPE